MATERDPAADSIEKLYKNYEILADANSSGNISEHEKEYMEILAAVKGSPKEKRLASQFIARFFRNFPAFADQALEAQLDLCEDDDVSIRKQAIKDLSSICKDSKEQVPKIADILAQLLQAEDLSELTTVQESLITLLKFDAKGTLSGIYCQLLTGDDTVRERCVKFLCKKVVPMDRSIIDKAAEDYLIIETKKVLQDVTGDEFIQLMHILSCSRLSQTPLGQKELVDIIADQAELDHPFDPQDESQVDRIIHCSYCALPYFRMVNSNKFVAFIINEVLSQLDKISKEMKNFKFVHLELLKIYAECCAFCKTLSNVEDIVAKTIDLLYRYVPHPPTDENAETNFEFTHIEAAMFALHQLGRIQPDVIKVDSELYRELKLRLHFLACHVQGYIKPLREDLKNKSKTDLKSDAENKLKVAALKAASNISTMIKDIFHIPPRYKAEILLSWKTSVAEPKTLPENITKNEKKRTASSSNYSQEDGHLSSKQSRPSGRELYHPPSGKFSTKVSGYGPSRSSNWSSSRVRSNRNFRGSSRWRY
ncbi:apoptosis inhibitor 5-like isoform X2 [Planococcus citri]|uniref:apoptosis inhibitor 5-like isoform X2 n=1 Tax=Planococcus citri TaxID=170843 RepID=UPI0031F7CF5F